MKNLKNKLKLAKESASTILKNVASGNDLKVSEKVYNQRMAVCQNCECYNKTLNKCEECGCFLAVKAKLCGMRCPKNKWRE